MPDHDRDAGDAGDATPSSDEIHAQTAAAIDRSRRLAGDLARTAAAIADTEDRIADERERTAAEVPDRADSLRSHARAAREFAEHERAEHDRLKRTAEQGPAAPDPAE